jgi:hypothetical protein
VPLTVDDLAEHLNIPAAARPAPGSGRYGELQRALDTAVEELTRMTGRLDAATVTARVTTPVGAGVLRLPYVNLTAIGPVRTPSGVPVEPVWVDPLAGLVWVDWALPGNVWLVDCTGSPWPTALETAALDWAAHIFDTQRTTLNPTADDDTALPSFALPNRVSEFARPYLLPGMA